MAAPTSALGLLRGPNLQGPPWRWSKCESSRSVTNVAVLRRSTTAVPFNVRTERCFSTPEGRPCFGMMTSGRGEVRSNIQMVKCTGNSVSGQADETSETSEGAAAAPQKPANLVGEETGGDVKKPVSDDEIGNAIRALREERVSAGLQDPTSTSDFWKGVVEETKLIEWPPFPKVLVTTGVVVAMILGSSVVLLTVNALLSQLSDGVFKNI